MLTSDKFVESVLVLYDEAFIGRPEGQDYTWIVERERGGLFDTLEGITAEQASYKPSPETNSIVAHVNHLRQALAWSNAEYRGEKTEGDWEATWLIQQADEGEWSQLVADLKREYSELRGHIVSNGLDEGEEAVIEHMVTPAHAFYHLGAVHQLIRVARGHFTKK